MRVTDCARGTVCEAGDEGRARRKRRSCRQGRDLDLTYERGAYPRGICQQGIGRGCDQPCSTCGSACRWRWGCVTGGADGASRGGCLQCDWRWPEGALRPTGGAAPSCRRRCVRGGRRVCFGGSTRGGGPWGEFFLGYWGG